ncbi:diaminopimelate epimerase [Haloplasma contractile]|uniref:Diaminopimelate epimerase n=1 Tax=Haloplasma contractile SSD-17B TaxID=1033810 RepID=U2ECI4_9MOLU|nr:diaminopimelate epimerase [Haloplasma contractile]ERJ12476.1 Diaminopimelate epimerase protein [Haloplasma contractile SSD-17B]
MYFEKFHGTGNDFIIIENLNNELDLICNQSDLTKQICNRHFGIGADGMMIVCGSEIADIKMMFYNQDGSIAPMCGNGIRCFAKYVYDKKIVNNTIFTVETLAGTMKVELIESQETISFIRINLGYPEFNTVQFPIDTDKEKVIDEKIAVGNRELKISTLNMGTIHTVLYTENLNNVDIDKIGKTIEEHELFPEKTNVNIYEINDHENITLETYERGVGRTLACGTGCAATAVISNLLNNTSKSVNVHVRGGILKIEISNDGVFMTGPTERICKGEYIVKH